MFIEYRDIGKIGYKPAWEYQQELLDKLVSMRKENDYASNPFAGWFLAVEHPHVYTLGKSGNEQNMLLNIMQLHAKNAEFVHTNRGGDITYHGRTNGWLSNNRFGQIASFR